MTSALREKLPVKPSDVKVSELKAKAVHAVMVAACKIDANVYDLLALLLLVLSFARPFPWYVYVTAMLIELALISSSNRLRDRSLKEKLAAARGKTK